MSQQAVVLPFSASTHEARVTAPNLLIRQVIRPRIKPRQWSQYLVQGPIRSSTVFNLTCGLSCSLVVARRNRHAVQPLFSWFICGLVLRKSVAAS